MNKFIEIIESKKIKESETKVNIQKQEDVIKNFLSLDKNIQKEIIDVAEKKYFKEFPEVEKNVVFKKVKEDSYFLYLKMLYPKLLDTLKRTISEVLNRFNQEKLEAVQAVPSLKERYSLESVYANITEKLEDDELDEPIEVAGLDLPKGDDAFDN